MKIATWIATWNIERLKHKKQINTIISECESLGADILILTETDTSVKPDFKYFFQTELLQGITEPVIYNDTESRVSIFTNYETDDNKRRSDPARAKSAHSVRCCGAPQPVFSLASGAPWLLPAPMFIVPSFFISTADASVSLSLPFCSSDVEGILPSN